MNQPIQENKDFLPEAVKSTQNTSREEIRERWRKYVASEVEVSPTKLLIWWLAEIEAAEIKERLRCTEIMHEIFMQSDVPKAMQAIEEIQAKILDGTQYPRIVEHCGSEDCPECNQAAFQAGYDKGVIDGKDGMDDTLEVAYSAGRASMLEDVKMKIKNMLLWSKGTVEGTRNDIIAKLSSLTPPKDHD